MILQREEQVTNKSAVMIAIIINPCACSKAHVNLVSLLQHQVHPVGYGLNAATCTVIVHCHCLLPVLEKPQPHVLGGDGMAREAEVVNTFHWCSEDTCDRHSRTQCVSLNVTGAQPTVINTAIKIYVLLYLFGGHKHSQHWHTQSCTPG